MKILSNSYRFYKYVYYRLYTWNLKTWGESDLPQVNAMLGVAFLFGLHCVTIIAILEVVCNVSIINQSSIKRIGWPLIVISLSTNYFIFLYDKKYKLLSNEFAQETAQIRKRKTYLAWLYVFASFGILGVIGALHKWLKT